MVSGCSCIACVYSSLNCGSFKTPGLSQMPGLSLSMREILKMTFPSVLRHIDRTCWWHSCIPWASCQIRKIAGAHAPGMSGTFSPPQRVSDPDMHHGTCVTHVPWCMTGSLTSVLLWSRRRGETFPASGKRPIGMPIVDITYIHWRSLPNCTGDYHDPRKWVERSMGIKFCLCSPEICQYRHHSILVDENVDDNRRGLIIESFCWSIKT